MKLKLNFIKKYSIIGTSYWVIRRDDGILYGESCSPYEWVNERIVGGCKACLITEA